MADCGLWKIDSVCRRWDREVRDGYAGHGWRVRGGSAQCFGVSVDEIYIEEAARIGGQSCSATVHSGRHSQSHPPSCDVTETMKPKEPRNRWDDTSPKQTLFFIH